MQPQRGPARDEPHGHGAHGEEDDEGRGRQDPVHGPVVRGFVDVEVEAAEDPARTAAAAGSGYSAGRAVAGGRTSVLRLNGCYGGWIG